MSFYQANPCPGLYLSLAGSVSPKQQKLLAEVLIRYPHAEVLAATDNDPQGEQYAALIQAFRSDAVRRWVRTGTMRSVQSDSRP